MVGIYAPGQAVARLAYVGLHALQHRGQESAGIATSDGTRLVGWWIPAIFALFCAVLWVFAGRFVFGAGWRPPAVVRRPTRRPASEHHDPR